MTTLRWAVGVTGLLVASASVAAPPSQLEMPAPVEDSPIWAFVLVDQLEHRLNRGRDALGLNTLGWVGGDYNRLWFNAEGELPYGESVQRADAQALYGRMISPFWDVQAGVRYSRAGGAGSNRGSAVLALQGLAPYWFETQVAAFVSHKGEVSGRVEIEYDLLFTQRLIAQPRLEANVSATKVPALAVGRGLNDIEVGFRLRYELMREFAPYLGVSWSRAIGETANLVRDRGGEASHLGFLTGLRLWY